MEIQTWLPSLRVRDRHSGSLTFLKKKYIKKFISYLLTIQKERKKVINRSRSGV